MDIFKIIYEGFEKHGIWFIFQVLVLFVIVAGILLFALWVKNKLFDDNNVSNVEVNVNLGDHAHSSVDDEYKAHYWGELINHAFFRIVQRMINYEILHLEIKEPLRKAIFTDFLLFKFTVTQDKVKAFINNKDFADMPADAFHNHLYNLETEIIQDYEAMARKNGIPEVVINKFNRWHTDKADVIYQFINDICDGNDWYVSNTVKFYSFLNQMVSILDVILIDARKTLISLNGELDKVVYKGIVADRTQETYSDDYRYRTFFSDKGNV